MSYTIEAVNRAGNVIPITFEEANSPDHAIQLLHEEEQALYELRPELNPRIMKIVSVKKN